jgi:hypothetical protein
MATHVANYVPPSALVPGVLVLETRTPIDFSARPIVPEQMPPSPPQNRYVTRGWHPGTSVFVHWVSIGEIDVSGAQYPHAAPPFVELVDLVGVARLPAT